MPAVPRDNHNETLAAYRRFIDEIFGRHNAQRAKTIAIERASLAALPANRTVDFEEVLDIEKWRTCMPFQSRTSAVLMSSRASLTILLFLEFSITFIVFI